MRIVSPAAVAAAVALLAPSAQAATPETGEVSAASPKVRWTGEAYGQPLKFGEDFQTHELCIDPFCDGFALTVAEAGNLRVNLNAPGSAGYVDVLVTFPDGTAELVVGEETETAHEFIYKNAAPGTYLFDIWPNRLPVAYDPAYRGDAELCVAPMDECFLPPPEEPEEF